LRDGLKDGKILELNWTELAKAEENARLDLKNFFDVLFATSLTTPPQSLVFLKYAKATSYIYSFRVQNNRPTFMNPPPFGPYFFSPLFHLFLGKNRDNRFLALQNPYFRKAVIDDLEACINLAERFLQKFNDESLTMEKKAVAIFETEGEADRIICMNPNGFLRIFAPEIYTIMQAGVDRSKLSECRHCLGTGIYIGKEEGEEDRRGRDEDEDEEEKQNEVNEEKDAKKRRKVSFRV
jgi:hypothetical protein